MFDHAGSPSVGNLFNAFHANIHPARKSCETAAGLPGMRQRFGSDRMYV